MALGRGIHAKGNFMDSMDNTNFVCTQACPRRHGMHTGINHKVARITTTYNFCLVLNYFYKTLFLRGLLDKLVVFNDGTSQIFPPQ